MSEKTKLREGWIEISCGGTDSEGREFYQCDMYFEPVAGLTHVREIIPGEIAVTREMLERAMASNGYITTDSYFKDFCRSLGFKEGV